MPRQDLALFDGKGQYDVGAVLQSPSEGIWGYLERSWSSSPGVVWM
jgi:hypothetical protein